jgi:hypothetical protein
MGTGDSLLFSVVHESIGCRRHRSIHDCSRDATIVSERRRFVPQIVQCVGVFFALRARGESRLAGFRLEIRIGPLIALVPLSVPLLPVSFVLARRCVIWLQKVVPDPARAFAAPEDYRLWRGSGETQRAGLSSMNVSLRIGHMVGHGSQACRSKSIC